jgi:hypothetical protein
VTRTKALVLIVGGCLLFETVAILGMHAAGLPGEVLSLGALIPLVVGPFCCALVIMHFGAYGERSRR